MPPVREIGIDEALRAGRALFGAAFAEGSLLAGDWRRELRSAFRRRALETHPDRARALGRPEAALAREFERVREAYRLLASLVLPGAGEGPRAPSHPARPEPFDSAASGGSAQGRLRPTQRAGVEGAESIPPRRAPRAPAAPGRLPQRRLRLGELLYHSGLVTFADLAAAVAAQRATRPALGRIAVELGFLTAADVQALLARRRAEGARGIPFATYAVRAGALTPFERLAAIGRQARAQPRMGAWFVERGLVSEAEIAEAAAALVRHNARYAR